MQSLTPATDRSWDLAPEHDFLLPPPRPADRIACRIAPRDLRRLDLYAVLTAAGIAPQPGDREVIDELSALSDSAHEALHRWLSYVR
ncbi:hypothetical protein [Streptomyces sp. NPDC052107]|uniref:hypothetical protein n=1 Tax=Streptomyces sp. NPDC052107 TaxID=3155632 RepID=UPI003412E15B